MNYDKLIKTKSDINEHLLTLKHYANLSTTVTEFGTRHGVSTQIFDVSTAERVFCYDINFKCDKTKFSNKVKLIEADITTLNKINQTDLLFIDSFHTYKQCFFELTTFSDYINNWIILHDTVLFGKIGQDTTVPGLIEAIEDFIEIDTTWKIFKIYTNNNGLTILQKIKNK